jgi:hypothetical protein
MEDTHPIALGMDVLVAAGVVRWLGSGSALVGTGALYWHTDGFISARMTWC